MRRLSLLALLVVVAACGGGGGGTTPTGTPSVQPTPAPAPTPTPNPFAAACGTPLPPMEHAYGIGIKVQLEPTNNKKVLNGSPSIRNAAYCQAAGFPGSTICNTRKEGHPEREACDHYLAGMSDQGRPGPNWYRDMGNERLVKCGEEGTGCALKEENQYLLDVYEVGRYVACAGRGTSGTCGDCIISTMSRAPGSTGGLCGHQ
jgi:hypothetical protein